MGCGSSKIDDVDEKKSKQDLAKLQLSTSQIKAFRNAFRRIDKNNNGSINIKEFLESLNVERTVIAEEIFEDMDMSNDGNISFSEFTLMTWRFCTRGLDSIAEFAFSIYDTDNSGELTKQEIKDMIIESYGKVTEKHSVNAVLHAFDKDGDDKISKQEFVKTVRKMPNIMQPAMFFQHALKRQIGNDNFWRALLERAEKVYDRPEIASLFKTEPRKIHVIRKSKKHVMEKKMESLDVNDEHHSKVNAHYYKQHHEKFVKEDEKNKSEGKKDMYSLS